MSKQKIDKAVYREAIVTPEGEVESFKTVYRTQSEPDFIKLYIDCLFTVKGIRKGINPIFLAFLEHMSYADSNGLYGGQVIYVNKAMKMNIAKKLNLGIDSINKGLSELTKHGVFKRIDVGTYQVNPNIVGKGEWKDIKNIRANFDFASKEVVAEIVRNEEEVMTEQQEALSKEYEEKMENQLAFDEVNTAVNTAV